MCEGNIVPFLLARYRLYHPVHFTPLQVGHQSSQEEDLCGSQIQILYFSLIFLPHSQRVQHYSQSHLCHSRDSDLGESVDDSNTGDREKDDPPEPEDEEVVLVEHVIGEKAESVGCVCTSCYGSNMDSAGYFRGEHLAKRVLHSNSLQVIGTRFVREILNSFGSIVVELAFKKPIQYLSVYNNRSNIEEFTEGKAKVIDPCLPRLLQGHLVEPTDIFLHGSVFFCLCVYDQLVHHPSFEGILPDNSGELGDHCTDCQHEWKPNVIVGCSRVRRSFHDAS